MVNKYNSQQDSPVFTYQEYELRICNTYQQLTAVFKLRYEAYRAGDLIAPNNEQKFYDAYDEQPNTQLLGVWRNGECIGAVRTMVYSSYFNWQFTSLLDTHQDSISKNTSENSSLIESSRFAIAPDLSVRSSRVVMGMIFRALELAQITHNVQYAIATVRVSHQAFYAKYMEYRPIANYSQEQWNASYDSVLLLANCPSGCSFPYASCNYLGLDENTALQRYATLSQYGNIAAAA
ncbi:MAG: hypothetical protein KI786_05805 [Mameliella sp.]|nr:hypothetical protein [Phaeodactylibacter sp.]